jgi:endoglucanase
VLATAPARAATGAGIPDGSRFYVPAPSKAARQQIAALRSSGDRTTAELITRMVRTPSAVWFTKGTPAGVLKEVRTTVNRAAEQNRVPVLVAYNLPFRDCAQYSAGGALSVAAYRAWIDGFAAGIGDRPAVVILEPDGLGIIPWYTTINGTQDWCQPAAADPATAAADRFAMLNYAVDALKAKPNASVYLDGTHSAWLGAGDAADRLVKAGVQRANGFFVNVSNYQATPQLLKYGTWISKCIYYGTNAAEGGWRLGHFDWCASQYYPATPSDFSTWGLTDQWYADNVDNAANPPSGPDALAHFVVDTSRNGQGPWTLPAGTTYPDPQDWCNPPDRGVGVRPTTDTGNPLADAFLWIKIPGESDGQCDRGTGTGLDPARGNTADPAAGVWFPQQAVELATLANPPLAPTP